MSNILPDKDGNFWYSTIGEGLFYDSKFCYKNSIIKNKNLFNEIVTKIDGDGGNNIWCGTSNNGVGNIDGNLYYKSEIFQGINALKIYKESVYFCGNNAFYKNNNLINTQPFKALSIFRDSIALATTFGINFYLQRILKFLYHLVLHKSPISEVDFIPSSFSPISST
ncbi:MAG: hypothetical protein IPP49_06485 [Saprospiraceae bacterium]|nr:hypothetical protein [Saprospiraceae bacterium]